MLSEKIEEITQKYGGETDLDAIRARVANKDEEIKLLQATVEQKEAGINKMSVLIEKCKQISEGYNQERELLMM